jgi:hypothetical protein
MNKLDFDEDFDPNMVNADDTKGLYAEFYIEPMKDEAASVLAGRPIFKDVELIKVGILGDRNTVDVMFSNDYHRQRWPRQYQFFKHNMEDTGAGTPLKEVPWVSRSQVEEFKFLKIRTVEDLANIADNVCTQVGGGMFALKKRAQAHIEEAAGGSGVAKLAAELEELKKQMAGMIAEKTSIENTKAAQPPAKG